MKNQWEHEYVLFMVVVNNGKASKVMHYAMDQGVRGGTVMLGEGTVKSGLLDALGLNEFRKEILLSVVPKDLEDTLHTKLTDKFQLYKRNHGICFSMPVRDFVGSVCKDIRQRNDLGGESLNNHELIITIVDRHVGEDVIHAAEGVGSTGGTIMHGRGSGVHEHESFFNLHIEPEKEIVLIISPEVDTPKIVEAITEKIDLAKPGNGVLFTIPVNRASGLFTGTNQ